MQITIADFRREIDGKRLSLMASKFIDTPESFAVFQDLADHWEKRSPEMDKNTPINTGIATVRSKDFYRTVDGKQSYASIPAGAKVYYAQSGQGKPVYLLMLSPKGVLAYRVEV